MIAVNEDKKMINFDLPNEFPEDLTEQFEPNWIQYLFGIPNVQPPIGTGGFFAKSSMFYSKLDGKFDEINYTFASGDTEQGYFFETLHFSVLADVLVWRDNDGLVYPKYQPGLSSELRVFCLVREFDYEPVVLKLGGKGRGQGFSDASKDFLNHIVKPVSATKGRKIPRWMFWMPVKAGPFVKIGNGDKKSTITPPVLGIDIPIQNKKSLLADLYIGPELTDLIMTVLHAEAAQWKKAQLDFDTPPIHENTDFDIPPIREANEQSGYLDPIPSKGAYSE